MDCRHGSWELTGGQAGLSSGEMTGAQRRSWQCIWTERIDSRGIRRWKAEGDGCWVRWEEKTLGAFPECLDAW